MSEDPFGPPQWGLDSVMKTSLTKNFKVNPSLEIAHQKSEMDIYRRDIAEKDAQIQKLNEKCAHFELSCRAVHSLILELEAAAGTSFLADKLSEKSILITHMDYVRILKESITFIIDKNDHLADAFAESFAKIATETSEELIKIRNELIKTKGDKEKVTLEAQQLKRLHRIHETECRSLQDYICALQEEKSEIDASVVTDSIAFKQEMNKLKETVRETRRESEKVERKLEKIKNKPQERKRADTKVEDLILQKEIKELSYRYDLEANQYDNTMEEYKHIQDEIKRGKEHIEKHRNALNGHEIEKAHKTNQELRSFIEEQRETDKRKYDSQVKKNKDLERMIQEHLDERNILKQYLGQLEKKIMSQSNKLPLLQSQIREQSQSQAPIKTTWSRHKADDIELKLIKRTMTSLSRKKQATKTLNLPHLS